MNKTYKLLILFTLASIFYLTAARFFGLFVDPIPERDHGILIFTGAFPAVLFTAAGTVSGICVLIFLIRYVLYGSE